jgi:hypothetical protein
LVGELKKSKAIIFRRKHGIRLNRETLDNFLVFYPIFNSKNEIANIVCLTQELQLLDELKEKEQKTVDLKTETPIKTYTIVDRLADIFKHKKL